MFHEYSEYSGMTEEKFIVCMYVHCTCTVRLYRDEDQGEVHFEGSSFFVFLQGFINILFLLYRPVCMYNYDCQLTGHTPYSSAYDMVILDSIQPSPAWFFFSCSVRRYAGKQEIGVNGMGGALS